MEASRTPFPRALASFLPMHTAVVSALSPSVPASLTVQEGIHPLLKAVRAVYRAQHRKPQFEPICVQWIERFVRAHPTRPIGHLGAQQVQTFLTELASQGEPPERQAQAREALQFLRTEVLRSF